MANGSNVTPPDCTWRVEDFSGGLQIGLTIAYVIVFLVAVCGNSAVIFIFRPKVRKAPFNILIIHLAACDIVYAITVVPYSIVYLYTLSRWFSGHFGEFLCRFSQFATSISVYLTLLTLTVMAIDRYRHIIIRKPLTRKTVKISILTVWVISCLAGSSELFKFKVVVLSNEHFTCRPVITWDVLLVETLSKFIFAFCIPLVTMVIIYASIMRFLCQRKAPGVQTSKKQRRYKKQTQGVIAMLVSMVTVFVLGWLPVYANMFLITFDHRKYLCLPHWVPLLFYWLAHAHCAVNSCLYLVFNTEYRRELVQTLFRGTTCNVASNKFLGQETTTDFKSVLARRKSQQQQSYKLAERDSFLLHLKENYENTNDSN